MGRVKKNNHKFRVGDRVIYHAKNYGDGFLNGKHGTVIYVDGTRCPYTVEFDDAIEEGLTDNRVLKVGIIPRRWQSRFCREENLVPEVSTR